MNKISHFLLRRQTIKTLMCSALFIAFQENAVAQVINGLPNVIAHISFDSTKTSTIQYPKAFSFKSNKFKYTTNRFGLKGSASEKSSIALDSINTESILDSCTISFWYKSNRKDESIITLNQPNMFNLKVYTKAGNVYAERTENLNKKWSYARACVKNVNVSDNEWHQITVRFAELHLLTLNVDISQTTQTTQMLQLMSKKERINLSQDFYGSTEKLYDFESNEEFSINYNYSAIDDITISSAVFNSKTIRDNYYANNFDNRLKEIARVKELEKKEIARVKELEKKRLEGSKFTTKLEVLNYLSNKSFVNTDGDDKYVMNFDQYAQNFYQQGNNKTFKLDGIRIMSEYRANLDYYENDPRLAITIEVNSNLNTIKGISPFGSNYKLTESQQITPVDRWKIKGVYRVEMKNPRTNSYDEIMMTNPGKYIEIRNDKDVRISDIDLFSVIFGREYLLLYNYAEFINGQRQNSTIPQTIFYSGKIELKNNQGTNSRYSETGVYFMEGSGKRLVEIANDICKCYVRLYYSDQVGLNFLK